MATVTTRDLGALISKVGESAMRAQKDAVMNAAFHMKNAIEGERSNALKGKDYFSQMMERRTRSGNTIPAKPGAQKLSVWFNVKGVYNPTALLVARGPWGILEYGTPDHPILGKSDIRGRSNRARYERALRNMAIRSGQGGAFSGTTPLRTPYGPRYRVNVRGVKPKKPFEKGFDKSHKQATKIATSLIQSRVIREVRTQFDTTTYIDGQPGAFRQLVG